MSGSGRLSFIRFLLGEECDERGFERVEVAFDRIPEYVFVDELVGVDDEVSHAADLGPGNRGRAFLDAIWDVLCGFADDVEVGADGADRLEV